MGLPERGAARLRAAMVGLNVLLGITSLSAAPELAASALPHPPTFAEIVPDAWAVTLSGTLQGVPRYPGASGSTISGYPGIDVRRIGEQRRFSAPDDAFSLPLYDGNLVRSGPTARFVPGRYYGDDRHHLFGLRDVPFALEPGLFVEFYPVPVLRLRGEIRHGIFGHHGMVGTVGFDYIVPSGSWEFSLGPRLNLGDARFSRQYFGVTPAEAARNGRITPYTLSGYRALGMFGAVTFRENKAWAYTAFAGYNHILGSAANSPLVRSPFGSPNQITMGLTMIYTFAVPSPF